MAEQEGADVSTFQEIRDRHPGTVRTMLRNPSFVRLRQRWKDRFGDHREVELPSSAIQRFWHDLVDESQSSPGVLRKGWLTGEGYDAPHN